MAKQRNLVRLTLSPEQQEEIKRATGKDAETIELTIEELEARIVPVAGRLW